MSQIDEPLESDRSAPRAEARWIEDVYNSI